MYQFLRCFSLIALGLLVSPLWGQVVLELNVNGGPQFTESDAIEFEVVVRGIRDDVEVRFENANDFEIENSGVSSQISIINGVSDVKKVYQYNAIAKKIGNVTLGPAVIDISGTTYKSNSMVLGITKEVASDQNPGAQDYFAKVEVDKTNPFVNDSIILSFEVYTKAQVQAKFNELITPQFEGVWFKEIQEEENRKSFSKTINGEPYRVYRIRYQMISSKAGKVVIQPFELRGQAIERNGARPRDFFGFFDTGRLRRVALKTSPKEINFRPLPPVPAGLSFSGLVGKFSLKDQLSLNNLKALDSTTLSIDISGVGNLIDFKLPEFSLEGIKIYHDRPVYEPILDGAELTGHKQFKMALVPQHKGIFKLPPLEMIYFNTQTESYNILKTQEHQIQVMENPNANNVVISNQQNVESSDEKRQIQVMNQDLMPLKKTEQVLTQQNLSQVTVWFMLLFTFIGWPLVYVLSLFAHQKKTFRLGNRQLYLKQNAFKEFDSKLAKIKQSNNLTRDLYNLVREYIGHKFLTDGLTLTGLDIEKRFQDGKVNLDLSQNLMQFLKKCEMAQYAGDQTILNLNLTDLRNMIKQLDKEL